MSPLRRVIHSVRAGRVGRRILLIDRLDCAHLVTTLGGGRRDWRRCPYCGGQP